METGEGSGGGKGGEGGRGGEGGGIGGERGGGGGGRGEGGGEVASGNALKNDGDGKESGNMSFYLGDDSSTTGFEGNQSKKKKKKKPKEKKTREKKTSLAEFRQQMRSGDLLVYLVFLLIQTENLIIQNAYVTNKETDRRTVQPTDRETDKPSFKDTKGN